MELIIFKGNLEIQTQDGHKSNTMDDKQREIKMVPICSKKWRQQNY